ncbi:protein of unknown function [Pseudomonas sp. JV241A]|nr:protein of unknown function [Pseudomonas sp. JV241A]
MLKIYLTGSPSDLNMRPVHSDERKRNAKHPAKRFSSKRHCGAIAQLGERLHGMQEVSGSIPLSSTKFRFVVS